MTAVKEELTKLLDDYSRKIRNKAIDDFAEKIKLEISESIIWSMLVDSDKDNSFSDTSDKIVDYVINKSKEIAEQLKEVELDDKRYEVFE